MRYACTSCHAEKDSTEFYKDARNIFKGVSAKCKDCDTILGHEVKHAFGCRYK